MVRKRLPTITVFTTSLAQSTNQEPKHIMESIKEYIKYFFNARFLNDPQNKSVQGSTQ